jgi:hypothetical protein
LATGPLSQAGHQTEQVGLGAGERKAHAQVGRQGVRAAGPRERTVRLWAGSVVRLKWKSLVSILLYQKLFNDILLNCDSKSCSILNQREKLSKSN